VGVLVAILAASGGFSSSVRAGEQPLEVQVGISDREHVVTPAAGAVVWLPDEPADPGAAAVEAPRIASRQKTFTPRVVAVPVGATVSFPNDDPIFHNVFSTSEAASFDLGLYRNGDAKTQRFAVAGVVPIYCNIHPHMLAYVVVVPSRRFAVTGTDGVAILPAVPAGEHPVRVWHERSGDWSGSATVAVGAANRLDVLLDASAWRESAHLNKYGKPYPPPDDDETRY